MIIRSFVYSAGSAVALWLIVYASLLPVVDAGDGMGHGPDIGSAEWHSAVVYQTMKRKWLAAFSGCVAGIVAFSACLMLERRRANDLQSSGSDTETKKT